MLCVFIMKDYNAAFTEYELCDGKCAVCGGKFRPAAAGTLDAKELTTNCPACKKPVRKVFSTFNSPKSLSGSPTPKKPGSLS